MTVGEMHIEVKQATQNISANVRRKLLPEEIDWLLNKIQERFIKDKISPDKNGKSKFQSGQLDTDAIKSILTTEEIVAKISDVNEYEAFLPEDYSFLISDSSRVTLLCAQTEVLTSTTEHCLILPFGNSTLGSAPYFATLSIVLTNTAGSTTIALSDILTAYQVTRYTGINSNSSKYVIIDAVIWYLRNVVNLPAYYEKYISVQAPGCLIFPNYTGGSITIDGNTVNGTIKDVTYNHYNIDGTRWSSNRLSRSDLVSTMTDTPFVKSSYRSPISELWGDNLVVHGDDSFIVNKVSIDYIRKPRSINLLLNQDCELSEEFHQTICDLTTEYFKVMTADPSWELKMKDNLQRSPSTS